MTLENRIICGNNVDVLRTFDDNTFDLVVTSPPYGELRTYNGFTFEFEDLAKELFRVMKEGACVVWVVGDQTIDGSESGESFKQALYFKEVGFRLHDTMIYEKSGPAYPASSRSNRYSQVFEYCFVLAKPQSIEYKLPRLDKIMKPEDAAWLASAIDGEGCFRIRYNGKNGSCHANINLGNTNKEYVQRAKDITGVGSVWADESRGFYEWNVGSEDASKVAVAIYQYLIIKKEMAKTLISFQKMIREENKVGGRYSILSDKDKDNRKHYFDIMRALNDRDMPLSGLPEPDLRVITKGGPKTHNLIKDRPNRWAGFQNFGKATSRQVDGTLKEGKQFTIQPFGYRFNIWRITAGKGNSTKDEVAYKHPAIFPEELAKDHIITWSNKGDLILDPFNGSGTTGVQAFELGRNYIGIDISSEYCDIYLERMKKRFNLDLEVENVGKEVQAV